MCGDRFSVSRKHASRPSFVLTSFGFRFHHDDPKEGQGVYRLLLLYLNLLCLSSTRISTFSRIVHLWDNERQFAFGCASAAELSSVTRICSFVGQARSHTFKKQGAPDQHLDGIDQGCVCG